MAVRAGAEKAEYRLFKLQEVRSDRGCGMRLSIQAVLVEEGVFKTHFGTPAEALGLKLVDLQCGPENSSIVGVILGPGIPETVPHFQVELYGYSERRIEDVLLPPQDCLRAQQAKDRYTYAMQNMMQNRDAALKGRSLFNLPKYGIVKAEADKVAAGQMNQSQQEAAEVEVRENAGEVLHVSGSTLDDDEDAAAMVARGAAKAKAKKGGGRAPGPPGVYASGRGSGGKGRGITSCREVGAGAGARTSASASCTARSVVSAVTRVASGHRGSPAKLSRQSSPARSEAGSLIASIDGAEADDEDTLAGVNVERILSGWNNGRQLIKVQP